jgi:hypothetical protein
VAPLEYSSSSPAPSPLPSASEPLTYHVERTPAKQLPIYHINKRQGFLKQTRIRRITGNIADLKKHLQQGLKLEDGHIKINSLTKHIIIKVCYDRLDIKYEADGIVGVEKARGGAVLKGAIVLRRCTITIQVPAAQDDVHIYTMNTLYATRGDPDISASPLFSVTVFSR